MPVHPPVFLRIVFPERIFSRDQLAVATLCLVAGPVAAAPEKH